MHVHLKSLGCRLNEAELETWSRKFQALGHRVTPSLSEADLVVINTCAVTGEAVRKSRKLMHKVHRYNPQARLVVSGCFAALDPHGTQGTDGVDLVVDNRDKDRLVEITSRELNLHAMPEIATLPGNSGLLASGRQRAFIKVQDGCRYQCTFCVVTLARGEERSRPIGEIVDEINTLAAQGIQEVVLTGVHVGGYGHGTDSDLCQLVARVLGDTDIPRLRLGAVEPWDLPDRFWRLFDNPRFMPHLHLPLQSGSDRVLRRMARRCKVGEFRRLVSSAREQVADFNVTTDIIVGFPGENPSEWLQTMQHVERIGFGHLHIFAYSPRPGTRAAAMPEQVPREVIRARSQELHALGERMKRECLERHVGREFPVLVEGRQHGESGAWIGYTPNFLRVAIEAHAADGELTNSIRMVRLGSPDVQGDRLRGTLLLPG